MAWTTPSTFAYKEVLSSSKMNEQVRDNLLALAPGGVTFGSWTPTVTGVTGVTASGKWIRFGNLAIVNFTISGTGSTTAFTITNWPFAAQDTQDWPLGQATDNGAALTTPARLRLSAGTTTATLYKDMSGAAWNAAATSRVAGGTVVHEID